MCLQLVYVAAVLVVSVSGSRGPSYQQPAAYPSYEDYIIPVNYEFNYGVKDYYTGQDFRHTENRQGIKTSGSYEVALPDGRIQVVTYVADENGFVADVSYKGTIQPDDKTYPSPKPYVPYKPSKLTYPAPEAYSVEPAPEPYTPKPYPAPEPYKPKPSYPEPEPYSAKPEPYTPKPYPAPEPYKPKPSYPEAVPYPKPSYPKAEAYPRKPYPEPYPKPAYPSYNSYPPRPYQPYKPSYRPYPKPQPYRPAPYPTTEIPPSRYDGPLFRPDPPAYVAPVVMATEAAEQATILPTEDSTEELPLARTAQGVNSDVTVEVAAEEVVTNVPADEMVTEVSVASADEPSTAAEEAVTESIVEATTVAPSLTQDDSPAAAVLVMVQEAAVQQEIPAVTEAASPATEVSVSQAQVEVQAQVDAKSEPEVEVTSAAPSTPSSRPKYTKRPSKPKTTPHPAYAAIYSAHTPPPAQPLTGYPSANLSRYGNNPKPFTPRPYKFARKN